MREKMLGFHDVSHTDTKACRRKTWTADIRRLSLMSGALPVSPLAALALMVCTCMAAQTVMMIAVDRCGDCGVHDVGGTCVGT